MSKKNYTFFVFFLHIIIYAFMEYKRPENLSKISRPEYFKLFSKQTKGIIPICILGQHRFQEFSSISPLFL